MKTREELLREYFEEPTANETKKYNHTRGLLQIIPSTFDDDEISKFLKRAWQNRR